MLAAGLSAGARRAPSRRGPAGGRRSRPTAPRTRRWRSPRSAGPAWSCRCRAGRTGSSSAGGPRRARCAAPSRARAGGPGPRTRPASPGAAGRPAADRTCGRASGPRAARTPPRTACPRESVCQCAQAGGQSASRSVRRSASSRAMARSPIRAAQASRISAMAARPAASAWTPALGHDHELRAPVRGVGAAFDVSQPFELVDHVDHGRLGEHREVRELGDARSRPRRTCWATASSAGRRSSKPRRAISFATRSCMTRPGSRSRLPKLSLPTGGPLGRKSA